MRIGVDVRMINFSGIGTTIRGLLDHWTPAQREQVTAFYSDEKPAAYRGIAAPFKIYGLRQHWSYAKLLDQQGLDLFHMPHFDVPYLLKTPFVSTVHDLIHLLYPQYSTKPFSSLYAKILLRRVASRARAIIAVSENTRRDIIRFFPSAASKIFVINPAVGEQFRPVSPTESQSVLDKFGVHPGFLLYVGNLRGSKNTDGLLKAYAKYRKLVSHPLPLVLVGKNAGQYEQFPDGVRQISGVSHTELPAFYSAADVFLFPSFYEGFGLPPLEAMACGTPVIASNAGSLPEVCGDAAVNINPYKTDELADAIRSVLASSDQRKKMKERGLKNVKRFSWHRFAAETWALYERVVSD